MLTHIFNFNLTLSSLIFSEQLQPVPQLADFFEANDCNLLLYLTTKYVFEIFRGRQLPVCLPLVSHLTAAALLESKLNVRFHR